MREARRSIRAAESISYGSCRILKITTAARLHSARTDSFFAEGSDNELYVVDIGGGLYRIINPGPSGANPSPIPDRLSDTGCVQVSVPSQPASGLIPYDATADFWSDGADKSRWLAIPNLTDIDVEANGDFTFPPGPVLVKQFHLASQLIETRLSMRHPDGM